MKLKDIFAVEKDEETYKHYNETWMNLKTKYANDKGYIQRNLIFDEINSTSGYARKTYRGKIKSGIELTELELSMICDGGYSHFGGSSSIGKDGEFSVTVYTD